MSSLMGSNPMFPERPSIADLTTTKSHEKRANNDPGVYGPVLLVMNEFQMSMGFVVARFFS